MWEPAVVVELVRLSYLRWNQLPWWSCGGALMCRISSFGFWILLGPFSKVQMMSTYNCWPRPYLLPLGGLGLFSFKEARNYLVHPPWKPIHVFLSHSHSFLFFYSFLPYLESKNPNQSKTINSVNGHPGVARGGANEALSLLLKHCLKNCRENPQ